jgi:anti-anti-sigma factor
MLGQPKQQELLIDGPLVASSALYGQDVIVVSLAGEMDASNVGCARDAIDAAATGERDQILVVDLSALEFIDSAGIALLVRLAAEDRDSDRLRIVPSEALAVSRVMHLTGLYSTLRIARERTARVA